MARKAAKQKAKIQKAQERAVSPFTAQHGDYRPAIVVDLTGELSGKRQSMVRLLVNRSVSTVDKWLFDGGPGFEAPEAAAIAHVRRLWKVVGSGSRLTGRYDPSALIRSTGSRVADQEAYRSALLTLGAYQEQFPARIWEAFENVVRWDEPAGVAGSRMANHPAERRAHAKASVGFVASKIAEWRGYQPDEG
jgi:hypothetical protein